MLKLVVYSVTTEFKGLRTSIGPVPVVLVWIDKAVYFCKTPYIKLWQ
jgi:hypothetical protein